MYKRERRKAVAGAHCCSHWGGGAPLLARVAVVCEGGGGGVAHLAPTAVVVFGR
jgi:hypothetical protein